METKSVLNDMQTESEATKKQINRLIDMYDVQKEGLLEQGEFIKMMKDVEAAFLLSFFGLILECTLEFFRTSEEEDMAKRHGRLGERRPSAAGLAVPKRHGTLLS